MTTTTSGHRSSLTRERRRKKLSAQYLSWLIHSFFGLKLTLMMTIVLFTGAIAVLSEELDWLIYPEIRVESQPASERMDTGSLMDIVTEHYPDNGAFYIRSYPERPYQASMAGIRRDDGSIGYVWINPYTGNIQGELDYMTPGRFFSRLHGTLFLGRAGRILVNGFGVLVLVSLITGLIAYPKFWRFFLKRPRTGNLRVFLGDLHKLIGLWSLWIVLFIGLSGSWWFYQFPFVRYLDAPPLMELRMQKPLLDYASIPAAGEPNQFLPAAQMYQTAKEAYPDINFTLIRPPEHSADTYTLMGLSDEWLMNEWDGHKIYLNPYTAEIVAAETTDQLSLGQRFDGAMGPLHYGDWGSGGYGFNHLTVKLLWFIGGLAMTFLSVSGMLVYYKRARKASSRLRYYQALSRHIPLLRSDKVLNSWKVMRPWGGPMGSFKYVNVVLIIFSVWGLIEFAARQNVQPGSVKPLYPEQSLGPWTISGTATPALPGQPAIVPGRTADLKFSLSSEDLKEIKFLYARVGKPRTLRAPGSIIHGVVGGKHVHLPVPGRATVDSRLWVTAQGWDGQFWQVSWPLMEK